MNLWKSAKIVKIYRMRKFAVLQYLNHRVSTMKSPVNSFSGKRNTKVADHIQHNTTTSADVPNVIGHFGMLCNTDNTLDMIINSLSPTNQQVDSSG